MMPNEAEDNDKELSDYVREAMEATSETEESPEGRERDDAGKFVPNKDESEVDAAARLEPAKPGEAGKKVPAEGDAVAPPEGEQQPEGVRLLTEDKAPRGWSPAAREKWSTISPDIRAEILRREEASAVGVRQLQERFAPVENFVQGLAPYIQEAQQHGIQAEQYIDSVMRSERVLRSADVPGRFQEILRLYGVPLRDVINESVGQKILPPAAQTQQAYIPPEVAQELQQMRQWREQQENGTVMANIEAFAQDKEFFEDARLGMALLIENGAVQNLQEAYDAACWAIPGIREVMLQRQGVQANQKKASGASIAPSGGLDIEEGDDKDDDLADTVRKAYASSSTGRV
jgi:hypothetical protein